MRAANRMESAANTVACVYHYLSHITKKAVLCLQVIGGRMLRTPALARLQVIVIAPRLDVNRNLLLSIPHDKVSPFLRGRLAGRECLTKLCSSRGLDL